MSLKKQLDDTNMMHETLMNDQKQDEKRIIELLKKKAVEEGINKRFSVKYTSKDLTINGTTITKTGAAYNPSRSVFEESISESGTHSLTLKYTGGKYDGLFMGIV